MQDVLTIGRRMASAALRPLRGHGIRRRLGLHRDPPAAECAPDAYAPPVNPDDALDRMVVAAREKDAQGLTDLIAALDAARYRDLDVLTAAVQIKQLGQAELGLRLLDVLLAADPDYGPAHYERAVLLRHFHHHAGAVGALYQARRCRPDDFRVHLLLTHMLYGVSATEAAAAAALTPTVDDEEARQLKQVVDAGAYLTEFPRARAREIVAEVRGRYDWLDTPDVARAIHDAMDARRGFALVRLGDGEGAFARVDAADEARHADLYVAYRREWTSFLMGEAFDPVATGYDAMTRTLMDTAWQADVVGLPYLSWIEHEYDIFSARTIVCLLNVHRSLLAAPPAHPPKVCDQLMHMYLFTSGLIEPIIRKAGRLSVVTCLPDLPERLKRRFDLEEATLYLVPSEVDAPHLRPDKPPVGAHFPEVFHDMVARLSRPHDGRLFLIAAGTFGKFYALTIKRHGGVALDVGSLVDAWMNLPSRIGYDESLAL